MATFPPKPILVWVTPPGPNSWKVVLLLEELGLNYEIKSFSFADVKKKPFTDVNPNGRVPAIEDPNTGLTLWESGAIFQYVIELYDTEHRLSYEGMKERHLCSQWLHFQMSGQGPYYGQASWFQHLHPEKIPSAIDRYFNEINRVNGVLEGVLAKKESQWLVGDKMTFADLAFMPWNFRLSEVMSRSWDEVWEGLPNVRAWHERMASLPSWERCMDIRARCMDEQGLQWNGVPKGIETFNDYEKELAAKDKAEMS
ncbi:glutathione S- transferase, nitrogen catabolite repression regulator [Ciborinia camelliae]|nr:glutathione S- transferase, nitrogen catabolite repression regulator [Ciborinia camelliae]